MLYTDQFSKGHDVGNHEWKSHSFINSTHTIRRSFYQFKWKLFAQLNPSDGDYDERSTMASGARTHTLWGLSHLSHNGAHPAYPDCIFQCAAGRCCARQIKTTPRLFLSLAGCFINSIRCARESDRIARLINLHVSTLWKSAAHTPASIAATRCICKHQHDTKMQRVEFAYTKYLHLILG